MAIFIKALYDRATKYKVNSLTDYIAVKFPKHADIIRWLASAVMVLFFVCYLATQFSGWVKRFIHSQDSTSLGEQLLLSNNNCLFMYGRIYVRCLDRYNPKFLMLISFVIVPIATIWKFNIKV